MTAMHLDSDMIAARRRLVEKVEIDLATGCWLWLACRQRSRTDLRPRMHVGFGPRPERKDYAYRIAYVLFVGPIPPGDTIDHTCRNPMCVNPKHLEAKPFSENRSAVQRDYSRRRVPETAECGVPF